MYDFILDTDMKPVEIVGIKEKTLADILNEGNQRRHSKAMKEMDAISQQITEELSEIDAARKYYKTIYCDMVKSQAHADRYKRCKNAEDAVIRLLARGFRPFRRQFTKDEFRLILWRFLNGGQIVGDSNADLERAADALYWSVQVVAALDMYGEFCMNPYKIPVAAACDMGQYTAAKAKALCKQVYLHRLLGKHSIAYNKAFCLGAKYFLFLFKQDTALTEYRFTKEARPLMRMRAATGEQEGAGTTKHNLHERLYKIENNDRYPLWVLDGVWPLLKAYSLVENDDVNIWKLKPWRDALLSHRFHNLIWPIRSGAEECSRYIEDFLLTSVRVYDAEKEAVHTEADLLQRLPAYYLALLGKRSHDSSGPERKQKDADELERCLKEADTALAELTGILRTLGCFEERQEQYARDLAERELAEARTETLRQYKKYLKTPRTELPESIIDGRFSISFLDLLTEELSAAYATKNAEGNTVSASIWVDCEEAAALVLTRIRAETPMLSEEELNALL